jgi:hypothetical protein
MYPVPSFKVATDSPVASDRGTRTEYTTEAVMPIKKTHLSGYENLLPFNVLICTHTLRQTVDKAFRAGDQFNGSSGSSEGAGTSTMSELFPECRVAITFCKSTNVTVPGMASWRLFSAIRVVGKLPWQHEQRLFGEKRRLEKGVLTLAADITSFLSEFKPAPSSK